MTHQLSNHMKDFIGNTKVSNYSLMHQESHATLFMMKLHTCTCKWLKINKWQNRHYIVKDPHHLQIHKHM